MVQAMAHSRPPSYRSHISDHEVILPPVHHLPKPPVAEEPELEDGESRGPDNIVVTSADVLSSSQPINELTDKVASAADKLSFSVDIKDVSTDSSVVSVSSSTSSRSSRQQDGQVTIIHHQQATQESVPAVSAPVTTNRSGVNLVTVSPQSSQQPLSVSALTTPYERTTSDSHVIDVEGPDVEILAHL